MGRNGRWCCLLQSSSFGGYSARLLSRAFFYLIAVNGHGVLPPLRKMKRQVALTVSFTLTFSRLREKGTR